MVSYSMLILRCVLMYLLMQIGHHFLIPKDLHLVLVFTLAILLSVENQKNNILLVEVTQKQNTEVWLMLLVRFFSCNSCL